MCIPFGQLFYLFLRHCSFKEVQIFHFLLATKFLFKIPKEMAKSPFCLSLKANLEPRKKTYYIPLTYSGYIYIKILSKELISPRRLFRVLLPLQGRWNARTQSTTPPRLPWKFQFPRHLLWTFAFAPAAPSPETDYGAPKQVALASTPAIITIRRKYLCMPRIANRYRITGANICRTEHVPADSAKTFFFLRRITYLVVRALGGGGGRTRTGRERAVYRVTLRIWTRKLAVQLCWRC